MSPKTPEQLRQEIEAQQDQPATEGDERTAEGMETRTPERDEFFRNLEKITHPKN